MFTYKEWLDTRIEILDKKIQEKGLLDILVLKCSKVSFMEAQRAYNQSVCEHGKTRINEDVGYDVDEDGDERQHLEICLECGAERFVCDHSHHGRSKGTWMITA